MRTLAMLFLLAGSAAAAEAEITVVESPADALRTLLAAKPRVIAFGEYHQTESTKAIPSAIARFTAELLPLLAGVATDLVVESWITVGDCGVVEKQVVADVQETTQRPAETESEVVRLLKATRSAGIAPHLLELSCAEYRSLQPDERGKLDYDRLLSLVGDKLLADARRLLPRATDGKLIALYGGALHNDLYPRKELARYTFGKQLARATKRRYLEIDLYVPELIAADGEIPKQPWYARWQAAKRSGKAALVRRGANSYILVFAEQPAAKVTR